MNIKLKLAFGLLFGLLGAAVCVILAGCEGGANQDVSGAEDYFTHNPYSSDPRTEEAQVLSLVPYSVVVTYINQEVAFTVSGGEGAYHWYVSSSENGYINAHGANQAVYIVKQVAQNSITVQDDAGHYAVSYILESSSTNAAALSVSPAAVTLSGGQRYASFTVSGGTPPYIWTSGNVQLGTVTYSAASSYVASYTAVSGAYGQNVIAVVDSAGLKAYATVTQSQ